MKINLRIGNWNLRGRSTEAQIKLIKGLQCDIFCFQEVTPISHKVLSDSNLFQSLAYLPQGNVVDVKPRKHLGCSIGVNTPFILKDFSSITNMPFLERVIIAKVLSSVGNLNICSFHAPPGVNWGNIKPQSIKLLADWLHNKKEKTIVGMDVNCPKVDHPNLEMNEWWWPEEALLLGVNRTHILKDIYRSYIEKNKFSQMPISPSGPLVKSFNRSKRKKEVFCRYDYILATPDFEVVRVDYQYKTALRAGSDHAVVIAELQIDI